MLWLDVLKSGCVKQIQAYADNIIEYRSERSIRVCFYSSCSSQFYIGFENIEESSASKMSRAQMPPLETGNEVYST